MGLEFARFATASQFREWWEKQARIAWHYPFQDPYVLEAWEGSIGRVAGTQVNIILALTKDGIPHLAFPFVVLRRFGARIAEFPDFGVADYNAPILFDPEPCLTAAELWRNLNGALPKHDLAILRKMPADIHGAPNPLASLAQRRHASSGHRMNLGATWQMQGKSGSKQRNLRRKLRRLMESGEVRFFVASRAPERQELLTILFEQKRKRFCELQKPDPFMAPGVKEFYLACARLDHICHCAALFVEGAPVAVDFGFCVAGRFYGVLASMAGGEWRKRSCGTLLLYYLIELAIDQRLVALDFGIGDEEYKNDWCQEVVQLFDASFPSSALGFAQNTSMKFARDILHMFR